MFLSISTVGYKNITMAFYLKDRITYVSGFAQCPVGFYSMSMLPIPGVSLPGCIYVSQDRSVSVTWAVGQKMCKQMDARSNLPFFTSPSQISQFQGMAP